MRAAATLLPFALLLAGCAGTTSTTTAPPDDGAPAADPAAGRSHVVLAHIDTGVNPYHAAFRWIDPRAWAHPSTYLPGYPADAQELRLTLDAASYAEAVAADAEAWKDVRPRTLYWIPGTRIVGAITFGPGGTYCPTVEAPPANQIDPTGACVERPILDDFGHGTMTASRMAGAGHSLGGEALVVSVEGIGLDAVDWVAASGFVDAVSNSWGSLTAGTPSDQELDAHVRAAARRNLWLFASGNGLGFVNGVAGQPTQASPTFPPGVAVVGAHDNGYATTWHGAPAHVVADGYGGWRADPYGLDGWAASPEACCTSAAAPYAAGGAAAILLEARRILGDGATGLRGEGEGAIVAAGRAGAVAGGPLADGNLTLGELRRVLYATATPRPPVTAPDSDDGLVNWGATPGATPARPWPGDNPYCVGCATSPLRLSDVPPEANLAPSIGYGAVDAASVAMAAQALRGETPLPQRPAEDAFFAADAAAREALHPPG